MKKIIVLISIMIIISCQQQVKEIETIKRIGYDVSDKTGKKIDLFGGTESATKVWEDYIKAHNEGDLEAIKKLNFDDIKIWGPNGEFIDGSEAHINFLSMWFEGNSPKWEPNYFISNQLTDERGSLKQWVTSGHDLTMEVEGQEVKVYQVHDALIEDGKVKMFYIYERTDIQKSLSLIHI